MKQLTLCRKSRRQPEERRRGSPAALSSQRSSSRFAELSRTRSSGQTSTRAEKKLKRQIDLPY